MADGITFAGLPLLVHFNGLDFNVDDWLREWLPRSPAECLPKALVDDRKDSARHDSNRSQRPLPVPNYPPTPSIGINQLYWPTGALRWARGYFLADKKTTDNLVGVCHVSTNIPQVLKVQYNGQSIACPMFLLAPEPITAKQNGEQLFILPLVDARYWWQMSSTDIELERGDTWADVFQRFESFGTIVFPTIDAEWLTPDSVELTRVWDNVALLMDAVAHSLGLRVVRDPSGTTRFMTTTESQARFATNTTTYKLIAGDVSSAGPTPELLTVAFQKLVAGAVDCGSEWILNNNTTGIPTIDVIDTIHSTAFASFSEYDDVNPANYDELFALAGKISDAYFAYQRSTEFDMTLAGIHPWLPTGFDDYILFTFAAERETKELRIVGQGGNDGAPLEIESRAVPNGPFTRVSSMPKNFGVQHQLSQDGDVVEVLEPYFRLIDYDDGDDAKDHLDPGSWAFFEYVERTEVASDWTATTPQLIVKIFDTNYFAFTLIGEVITAKYSCKRHRWETISESGLTREVKPASTIANGATGTCDIYVNESITAEGITIEAFVGWLFGTSNAPIDVAALAVYFRNSGGVSPAGKWNLINRACS